MDEGMYKEDVAYIYNGILLSHEKEWNNGISATWMDLEIIIVSEINQTEKDKYHMISLLGGIFKKNDVIKWVYLQNRNRLTDIENKLTNLWLPKGKGGRDRFGIWD